MTKKSYAFRQGDRWVEIKGAWASMLGDHAPGWVDKASPADRQKAGAVEIVEGQLAPHPHQTKTGEEVADVNGVPTRRGVFVELTLDARKAEMGASLRTLWHIHEVSGFTGAGGVVPTDEEAQRRLLIAMVTSKDDAVTWEVRPGVFVPVTSDEIDLIAKAVFSHVAQCAHHAGGLHARIEKAKSHAELSAIDLSQGWPP